MPVPENNQAADEEMLGEEEEDLLGDEEEDLGEEDIPENPAAALAESRDMFVILFSILRNDAIHEAETLANQQAQLYRERRAQAVAAEDAGNRAMAIYYYLESERIKALWRTRKEELEAQEKVGGHNWLEELFRRIRQLEGYTGISPDPAIRYEGLRIFMFVSPRLRLNYNDTLRVQAFFHQDLPPEELPHNVGFLNGENHENGVNGEVHENGMNEENGAPNR